MTPLVLALTATLPQPAMAEALHDSFMQGIAPCLAGAGDDTAARACIGSGAAACMAGAEDGETTFGMTACLSAEADAWDRLLNDHYASARLAAQDADAADRATAPAYAVRVARLRDAQRAWIAFRDANCALDHAAWGMGSMARIAFADCRLHMTAERTLELRAWRRGLVGE